MEYVVDRLKELMAIPSPTGFTRAAAEYVKGELEALGFKPELTNKGGVLVSLGGEGDPLVLSAHLDTLGAMVAEIKGNGRLRLCPWADLCRRTRRLKTVLYIRACLIRSIRGRSR